MMSSNIPDARLTRLDGLRGMAVLVVLLFHTGPFLVPSVAPALLPGGFLGVDLFFVLSGFLMTNILLDRRRSYGSFYLRRVARIFPALYVLLATHFAYSMVVGLSGGTDLRTYALIGAGLGNWGAPFGITVPFSMGQTWSLGVEEQLYLLWPAVLLLCGRDNPGRVKRVCMVGVVGSALLKAVMFRSGVPMDHIYFQTEGRLDDFLVGALVATIWHTRAERAGDRTVRGLLPLTILAASWLGVCLALAHPYASQWLYEGGFTAFAAGCGVVLHACLHRARGTAWLTWRPLTEAGRYSYSIYLWHPFVFIVVGRAFPHDTPVRVLWAGALLVVASAVSTLALEEPLRRLAVNATSGRSERRPRALAFAPSGVGTAA